MEKLADALRLGRSESVSGHRYGVLIYGIVVYYFLSGVYSVLASLGIVHDSYTSQINAVLQYVSQGAIAGLAFGGALCLFVGRYFLWRPLALFGAAVVPAFRVYSYLVGPLTDPLVSVNIYFSMTWIFLLVFFSVIAHREITLLENGPMGR